MGKRRIRLIRNLDENINIVGIDTNEERRAICKAEWSIPTYSKLDDLLKERKINIVSAGKMGSLIAVDDFRFP